MTEKKKFTITDIKPDEFKALNENPTPAPQPLTDEEANHYWMVRRPNCDCTACRAIARIRADRRRIEALEEFTDWWAYDDEHDAYCVSAEKFRKLKAALEDKTK